MNFEKVILREARAHVRESESEKRMSPRGEAKQQKGTHEKERERGSESCSRACAFYSLNRERIIRVRATANAFSLSNGEREQ